jgi:hypothetical protein
LAKDPESRVRFPVLPEKNVVGLERGPLSLVSTTEELRDKKVAAPVYKTEITALGIRHADLVALTSPTGGSSSVGTVRSRTQATEFLLYFQDRGYEWQVEMEEIRRNNYSHSVHLLTYLLRGLSPQANYTKHKVIYD